jgi:MoxR-like ATPase
MLRLYLFGEFHVHWKACAIDGPGGGGKSTLAAQLASDLSASVISMDAFLLPEGKYRVSAIAKNYDLDRFYQEVTEPLLDERDINYRVMDLATGTLGTQRVNIPAANRVIIEGVYSMELSFRDSFNFTIFVDAPKEHLMTRAFSLEAGSRSWLDKWLEGEETYFVAQHPKLAATLVLDGTKPFPLTAEIMQQVELTRSQA